LRGRVKLELLSPGVPRVEEIWRSLEPKAKPTYFLTWGWVENWLACLPALEAPQLAVASDDDGLPLAAAFLGARGVWRHRVLPSRAAFLNATGLPAFDGIYIEHNRLLTDTFSLARFIQLFTTTLDGPWDELFMPALEAAAYEQLAADFDATAIAQRYRLRVDREVGDHYVDLAKVRAKDYVSLLGSSTRAQLRKAQRLATDLTLEIATEQKQATAIYDEMVELHQRAWQLKGQPGAFADPWFDKFHRRLIAKRLAHGEIQLVRVRAAGQTIACLYNFVSYGRVLFYQSGIDPGVDGKLKPGMLAHMLVVEHNAKLGHATYDFLGGDAQYKKSLATDETKIVWARVQKKHLRFAIEDRARAWVRARRQNAESEARED
jgi:CelD/BcsL family acetyltransferase involved in cellulose biosynthesis